MHPKNSRKIVISAFIFLFSLALLASTMLPNKADQVSAQTNTPTILVTGSNGQSINYTLTQLEALPSVTWYGGFYQPNQKQINSGLWTGVELLYLCDQVGGLSPSGNVTVTGQGNNTFTYSMIYGGLNLNQQYNTYNNQTGALQNQTQSISLILAYRVNGTDLPSSSQPDPRLVIIGPEGLLIDGSGGRSITQITVTSPTPSPTLTPTPTTAPTASPSPSTSPTILPSSTPTVSASPTPTVPEFSGFGSAVFEVMLVIAVVIVAVNVITKRK
jgi:hypothetical protein